MLYRNRTISYHLNIFFHKFNIRQRCSNSYLQSLNNRTVCYASLFAVFLAFEWESITQAYHRFHREACTHADTFPLAHGSITNLGEHFIHSTSQTMKSTGCFRVSCAVISVPYDTYTLHSFDIVSAHWDRNLSSIWRTTSCN